ncbi:MAG: hypothetical protein M1840_004497 [Geoglossum simile]|nr:MAG: hypothetical protein M1840_004497 [Geoglossum simile]
MFPRTPSALLALSEQNLRNVLGDLGQPNDGNDKDDLRKRLKRFIGLVDFA